jgi:ribosome-binding ATPase YchF (GTP1/OBG family)
MMLADLESIQKRLEKNNKKNVDEELLKILEIASDCINNDKDIKILNSQFEKKLLNQSGLLSVKPKIFVCNVDEASVQKGNKYTESFIKKFGENSTLIVSADIENQINQLENDEKENYMQMIGLKKTGLNMLIQKGYNILELDTYFTSGPEETRAWTIQKNCTAPKAAGEIHTDFEKGFIKAETITYKDFVENQGWINSKTNGKMRLEGKDYVVKDGDVLNFRFNT